MARWPRIVWIVAALARDEMCPSDIDESEIAVPVFVSEDG
jgi:hypothetical protein